MFIRIKRKKTRRRLGKKSEEAEQRMEEQEEQEELDIENVEPEKTEEKGVFVLPGDLVGTSEEYVSGEGTYEHKGNIYATMTGLVNINQKTRTISVIPKTNVPPHIEVGDVIVGRITDIKSSVALVEVGQIKGKGEREIVNIDEMAIHVSNVKNGYVKELYQEFAPFDIVKAKVIDIKNMRLSTENKDLGVMKAFCAICNDVLEKTDNGKLKCRKCDRFESRKISSDYGTGII